MPTQKGIYYIIFSSSVVIIGVSNRLYVFLSFVKFSIFSIIFFTVPFIRAFSDVGTEPIFYHWKIRSGAPVFATIEPGERDRSLR